MKLSTRLQVSFLIVAVAAASMPQHALATDEPSDLLSSLTNEDSALNPTIGDGPILLHRFLRRRRRPHRRRQPRPPTNSAMTNIFGTSCPDPSPGQACTFMYEPVDCDGCVYSNLCRAVAAGLPRSSCQDQQSNQQSSTAGTSCPDPSPDRACTMMYEPVSCDGCVYSNLCRALAAGLPRSSCQDQQP
jgi:hypothetical protein